MGVEAAGSVQEQKSCEVFSVKQEYREQLTDITELIRENIQIVFDMCN